MLGRLGVVVAVVAALGCGSKRAGGLDGGADSGGGKADGGGDGPSVDCEALSAQWHDLVASLSLACQQDGDCTVAGSWIAFDQNAYCPIAVVERGIAVNAAAYLQSPASALEHDWVTFRCGCHLDGICLNEATCAGGTCTAVPMNCCGIRGAGGRCPYPQACYYDATSSNYSDSCLAHSYESAPCTGDCPPASVCGGSCCGPGTVCRNPDSDCCVLLPDGGLRDSGIGDSGSAPLDAASADGPADGPADAGVD